MFSTFTGNSRRPRNVNLSGQAGNPFANSSWSPSVASNATKTVSDAQAEREKRHIERLRQKAAGKIQRTWRGFQARRELDDSRRKAFDELYDHSRTFQGGPSVASRAASALNLLVSFFSLRQHDDIGRLMLLIADLQNAQLADIDSLSCHPSRSRRIVEISVKALAFIVRPQDEDGPYTIPPEGLQLLSFITEIISRNPDSLLPSRIDYFGALSKLCRVHSADLRIQSLLLDAVAKPLNSAVGEEQSRHLYEAFAFYFLTVPNLYTFERNVSTFSEAIDVREVANAIYAVYAADLTRRIPRDQLLWLLSHFIDLGNRTLASSHKLAYLKTLHIQLSALSSEISIRLGNQTSPAADVPNMKHEESAATLSERYLDSRLLSLVDGGGLSRILQDFSEYLVGSTIEDFQSTSLLAGYILTLLFCFPAKADDIRMRLFLERIPGPSGQIPTNKFLWQIMHQLSVFQKLERESEPPVVVLRDYLFGTSNNPKTIAEEQEWRIILLFLELYIFILRLSDDEDFFSGIFPPVLEEPVSQSQARACSLPLGAVKALTTFLRNTAFALHYKAQEISKPRHVIEANAKSRLDSYLGSTLPDTDARRSGHLPWPDSTATTSTKLNLESLRGIITSAMKMLYERDSRKQFLPAGHWLMTDKLDQDDFISAVIAEEERQRVEDSAVSDEENETEDEGSHDDETGVFSTHAGNRVSHHARLEKLRAMQRRAQKERRLAELGPKLEILRHMPFSVPFETRVKIFRQFIHLDQVRRDRNSHFGFHPFARHQAQIRRGRLFDDAFTAFYPIGDGLKDPIHIAFIDRFNTPEAGIDGGGVTKEFLTSVISEAFGKGDQDLDMFTSNEKGLLYPDPTAVDRLKDRLRHLGYSEDDPVWAKEVSTCLEKFEFLGRIFGKCMYEGILVDVSFAGFFLLKWPSPGLSLKEENNYKGSVNDLKEMDEELYQGLLRLKNYSGDISDMEIDFTVTDRISELNEPIRTVTRKLIPNGDKVYVTNDTRLLYNSYVARHRLVVQPAQQTAAFLRGLRAIIKPSWISMFNQSELQRLIGGDSSEIDLEDLRRNTVYSGLYAIGDDRQEHPTIKLFWKVMASFTDQQRRDVVRYVSSTPRAPLLGFSQLNPKFSIRDSGTDQERLPSTSTCVNLLKLPLYTTESALREKLLYAVTSGAGFDLS